MAERLTVDQEVVGSTPISLPHYRQSRNQTMKRNRADRYKLLVCSILYYRRRRYDHRKRKRN